jgi:hypothetical protein
MKRNYYVFILCILLTFLTVNTSVSQSFVPVVPDSGATVVYIIRDPAFVGGAVPWPVFCLNRTQITGTVTKGSITKEHRLTNLKQKEYFQLNLIANMDYLISVIENGHYVLFNGKSGSVAFITIKGVKSYVFCHTGEIAYLSNSEGDLQFNADLKSEGFKLKGDPSSCQELLLKMAGYKQNLMKK